MSDIGLPHNIFCLSPQSINPLSTKSIVLWRDWDGENYRIVFKMEFEEFPILAGSNNQGKTSHGIINIPKDLNKNVGWRFVNDVMLSLADLHP
ncbi:hypothetical protein [Dyadobacter sp. NIV53]|uniref:hypothetical protein n=1 Tax=Dyadobacter sp. NIV53 TaxID=2861765 RepID=UPI001C87480A|nr:hypothetical protein [Dyadobacter sp. NIV53]